VQDESIYKLGRLLLAEQSFREEVKKSRATQRLVIGCEQLLAHIVQVGNSEHLALMIATERAIVEGDLARYANSKQMIGSLNAALGEIAAIERQIDILDDPEKYRWVDQQYSLDKNREKGLPLDEARQSFKSHHARLDNLDKSRLDDIEKQIIDARKSAFSNARRLYVSRQAKVLGVILP